MPRGRVYPGDDVRPSEKDWGGKKRRWMHQHEAAALGDPSTTQSWQLDDGTHVAHHGAKRMGIRAGKRPLLSVGVGPWASVLTPRQVQRGKVRTARAWGRMLDMMEKTGMTIEEFVQGLTPEELVRGKLRDKNGGFTGRPPAWVPHEFHRACIRELMRRGQELWKINYLVAIESMTQIAAGKVKGASAGDRLRAAQFVIERLEGKTPEVIVLADESPWSMIIDDIVAQVPDEQIAAAKQARNALIGSELGDIVDAEIVDEEPTAPPRDVLPPRRRSAARRRA